jgi:uncharacterized protein (DUF1800 family)
VARKRPKKSPRRSPNTKPRAPRIEPRDGPWSERHAERLLWRAGFGPKPGEAGALAALGRRQAIDALVDGRGAAKLEGPAPMALDPRNVWGHDVLWWLDRMVRTTRPLEEKMVLFWHDHFATRDQPTPLLLRQNHLLRQHALGRFPELLWALTRDPALAGFLSLLWSGKQAPNENFARELMELFTLGSGYTERDIREAARALTGYVPGRKVGGLLQEVKFDPARHDDGTKRIFGRRGRFGPAEAVRLCVAHPRHPGFLVRKLWSYFVTEPLDAGTARQLERVYAGSGHQVRPVVRAILDHPALYHDLDRPKMIKSPVVYVAGLLRTTGTPVERRSWEWLLGQMGQRPFAPPSVAGWEWGAAWMSSNAMRARLSAVNDLMSLPAFAVPEKAMPLGLSPDEHLQRARAATHEPWASEHTVARLRELATTYTGMAPKAWQRQTAADMTQRAMRHLLLSGPDAQLH